MAVALRGLVNTLLCALAQRKGAPAPAGAASLWAPHLGSGVLAYGPDLPFSMPGSGTFPLNELPAELLAIVLDLLSYEQMAKLALTSSTVSTWVVPMVRDPRGCSCRPPFAKNFKTIYMV